MNELRYYKLRHIVSALASPDFTIGVVFGDHAWKCVKQWLAIAKKFKEAN